MDDGNGICSSGTGRVVMSVALLTDLYEFTMAESFLRHQKTKEAVFSISVRSLPQERNFLVACGLESLVHFLQSCSFTTEDIAYLRGRGIFSEDFLSWLSSYHFSGDLFAVPEGRIVFAGEPLVRIEGPLPEVQILETMALNLIHHQTVIASKAARMIAVSKGKNLIDFGLRRTHGPEGGIYAARSSYITGFSATSNLEAGRIYDIPVAGTMAHSYIQVHESEEEAFRTYMNTYPRDATLLIDTYDTRNGALTAARLAHEGLPVSGVRIDSGDIASIVSEVRDILDSQGLHHIRIIVSGGVDEHDIRKWMNATIPIDAFGIGTRMVTSADAAYLDMTYKLVEYDHTPRFKTSPGKKTIPGSRDVSRSYDCQGVMIYDEIIPVGESHGGESLLEHVIRKGELMRPLPPLAECRERFQTDFNHLPDDLKELHQGEYPVYIR